MGNIYQKAAGLTCYAEGCERPVEGKGLCSMHRRRMLKHGSPYVVLIEEQKGKTCKAPNCFDAAFSKGYCGAHYKTVKKHGRDYFIAGRKGDGYITKDGYRQFQIYGERVLEHVLVAEKALGKPLPKGAVIHHINGDKLDNRPSNLVICPSQQYHMLLHYRQRLLGLDFSKPYQ